MHETIAWAKAPMQPTCVFYVQWPWKNQMSGMWRGDYTRSGKYWIIAVSGLKFSHAILAEVNSLEYS